MSTNIAIKYDVFDKRHVKCRLKLGFPTLTYLDLLSEVVTSKMIG